MYGNMLLKEATCQRGKDFAFEATFSDKTIINKRLFTKLQYSWIFWKKYHRISIKKFIL